MTPEKIKQQRIVELRKLCDEHYVDFSNMLLLKSADHLRLIARELGVEGADHPGSGDDSALRTVLVMGIREVILDAGGYADIVGRMELLADGSGFLRDVDLHPDVLYHTPQQSDSYDVYVPPTLIRGKRLRQGDIVGGKRRGPYPGEQHLVLLNVDEVKRADSGLSPFRFRAANDADSVPAVRPPESARSSMLVFISYRRDDSSTIAGRIADHLERQLGAGCIFKDVDSIPYGVDFVEHVNRELQKCTVLFAVIGPRWLASAAGGRRRLDDPNDYVRIEISAALRRDIAVVPVLVEGAQMPRQEELPDELKPLARRNGAEIRHDPDFHHDMSRLLSHLG